MVPHDANQEPTRPSTLHQRLYAALILLYPRAYRSRFATDMCLAFSERHAEAAVRGALSLIWLWLCTVRDIVTLAAVEHAEEMARRFKHAQLMTSVRWFVRDVMMGLRRARKQPGLAFASIVALALGIGLTATTFSIVYGTVMRGLPFENANELMHFERENPDASQSSLAVTPHDFVEWQDRQRSFIDLGAYVEATIHLTHHGNAPERYIGVFITPNCF